MPYDVAVVADALSFGPLRVVCADCHAVNDMQGPHRFGLPSGTALDVFAAEESCAADESDATAETAHGNKAGRGALLSSMQASITAYARETDSAPEPGAVDRAFVAVTLLFALGVVSAESQGEHCLIRSATPSEDPAERARVRAAAISVGGKALATAIRLRAQDASDPDVICGLRELVPNLEAQHWPLTALFAEIVVDASHQLGPVTTFGELLGLAAIAATAGVPMPNRAEWSRELLRAEADRPAESQTLLLDPDLVAATIDPAAIVDAVPGLAASDAFSEFWHGEGGRRARAALRRLIGEDAAGQVMQPRLDLRGSDGAPPDFAQAAAIWPRVLAALPDREPMAALMRAARDAGIDMVALVRDGVNKLGDAAPVRRAAFAAVGSRALAFDQAAVLDMLTALRIVDVVNDVEIDDHLRRTVLGAQAEALRGTGQFEAGRKIFASLYATATSPEDRHHANQGIASCLNQLGRLDEAVAILRGVVAEGSPRRRIMATNALARTLVAAGRIPEARAALEAQLDTLRAQQFDWFPVTQFASIYAQILWAMKEGDYARRWATEAHRCAVASGSRVDAALMERLLEGTTNGVSLESALAAATDPPTIAALALSVAAELQAHDEHAEAAQTLTDALARVEAFDPPELWIMLTVLATLAYPDDLNAFKGRLEQAVAALERLLARVTASSDPEALLEPHARERERLVSCALLAHLNDLHDASFLRYATDLVMAPILTARLRSRVEGAESLTPAALNAFWAETPCVLVQVILGATLMLVVSQPDDDGADHVVLHDLEIDGQAARKTVRALGEHVKRRLGSGHVLGLERVPGWTSLAAALSACLEHHARQWRLVVCPGGLGSLCFSLALQSPWSISFVPSLGTLLALRARRRKLPGGLAYLPQRMADFAVWQEGDPDDVVAALQGTEEDGRRIAANHDIDYSIALGRDATTPALLAALQQADVVRLACHGRIDPTSKTFELMVAADGELPPKTLIEEQRDASRSHRIEQRALAVLPRVAPYLFSSACCSGTALFSEGGERIGLERALLLSGSVAVCAPQWDVHAEEMRDQLATVLETWLGNERAGLDLVVAQAAAIGADQGIRASVARALAVFGDGLGRSAEVNLTMVIAKPAGRRMGPAPVRIVHLDMKGIFDG